MTKFWEFSEADWLRNRNDWVAWWNGTLERPLVVIETLSPEFLAPDPSESYPHIHLTKFPLEMPVENVLDQVQLGMDAVHLFGDAYPHWWVNFGPGIMPGFLGGGVQYMPGTTWYHELDGLESLADLHVVHDLENRWWQRVFDITQAAVSRWGQSVAISVTAIGGILDTLASLRGTQKLMFDFLDVPDEVERLIQETTQLWLYYFDQLCQIIEPANRGVTSWAPHWNPGRGYMLQSDVSYMISPEMFERFVMPDLKMRCEAMDYAFFHMDGKGQLPHLDHLLSLDRLRGIQWQPGDGEPMAEEWPDVLRRILNAGKLCQVYVTREGVRKILNEFGGKGFLFMVVESLTPLESEEFIHSLPFTIRS